MIHFLKNFAGRFVVSRAAHDRALIQAGISKSQALAEANLGHTLMLGELAALQAKVKAQYEAELSRQRSEHQAEIERLSATVDPIIKEFAGLQFRGPDRVTGAYGMIFTFDPMIFMSSFDTESGRRLLARQLCHKVTGEILSSRFVKSAWELERLIPRYSGPGSRPP